MNWNKYPFLRLAMALAFGILIRNVLGSLNVEISMLFMVLVGLVGLEVLLFWLIRSYRLQWIYGVATMLVIAYLGFFSACLQDVNEKPDYYRHNDSGGGRYLARVFEPPSEKENSVKVLLELKGFRSDSVETAISGKVIAYFNKTDEALSLGYGDMIAFSAPIEEVTPPLNPMEFDYKKYLERRGVTGRVYLKDEDWILLGVNSGNLVYGFSYRFRDRLLLALRRCGIADDEFGVAAAILLGYDESLPAQVRQNYVAAGSMHILCVSGMHVGIIYLLASFVLGFLGKGKRVALIRRLVLLFLIWFYALLTGLSPSVMRSSLMISFVVFGKLIHRKGFALNSIAASAFVLLLIDPNNLFAIGFQLSYVAVIGIVMLQRPIYNLLYIKNELLDKVWEITAVSLAAQVATMPFTVYYFQQFTPYFWLSNLFMTPLSFLVILFGMLLLMVSWIPWVNVLMGKLVWASLYSMNWLVARIECLPISLVKGLYVNDFQLVVSMLLLALLLLFVNLKKKRMLMEMLTVFVIFAFSLAWKSQQAAHQSRVVVYSLRKHTAISIVDGFDHVLLCDEGLLSDPSAIDYSLKGHWAEEQLTMNPTCHTFEEDFDDDLVMKRNHLVSTHGMLLALWDPMDVVEENARVEVDYLLVTGKQKPDLQDALNTYRVGTLLVDGSMPRYLAEKWISQADEMGVPSVDIGKGAFEIENNR